MIIAPLLLFCWMGVAHASPPLAMAHQLKPELSPAIPTTAVKAERLGSLVPTTTMKAEEPSPIPPTTTMKAEKLSPIVSKAEEASPTTRVPTELNEILNSATPAIDELNDARYSHLPHLQNMLSSAQLSALNQTELVDYITLRMKKDPRVEMNVPELVNYYGYNSETVTITTEDGYILNLHRMLGRTSDSQNCASKNFTGRAPGYCAPVLLQHGLLGSSSAWVMNSPDKALAYILSDLGYDVWMGNARGNVYSIGHTFLDVESWDYWNFCFDQMGKYDLPAVIDAILEKTGRQQLHYVGHSMGTTMFWVMADESPQHVHKVASMSALGPVAFVSHTTCPMRVLGHKWIVEALKDELIYVFHMYHLMDPNTFLAKLLAKSCSLNVFSEKLCSNLIFLLVGADARDLDLNWLPVIMRQLNAGASTRTLVHFGQLIASGDFAKYDYGYFENGRIYGETGDPPSYPLHNLASPVQLLWGPNDPLADPTDVKKLYRYMPAAKYTRVPDRKFSHMDFLWGINAKDVVYDKVISFMEQNKIDV